MRGPLVVGMVVTALVIAQPLDARAALPVATPTVTAPSLPKTPVPVPTVQAPSLPAPTVTAPSVQAPSVPSTPVPVPSAPAPSSAVTGATAPVTHTVQTVAGGGSATGGGGAPAPAGGTGAPATSTVSGGGGGGGAGGTGAASGGGAARAGAGAPGSAAARAAAGGRSGRVTSARPGERRRSGAAPATSAERRHERRLRRIVRRLDGCLPALDATQRRVLVLRAGIGPATPASRAQVASRLGVSRARVARLERRGVRALRRLDRATGCAPDAGSAPVEQGVFALAGLGAPGAGATGGGAVLLASTGVIGVAGSTGSSSHGSNGGGRGAGSQNGNGPARGGVEAASAEQPATVLPPDGRSGRDVAPIVLLVALLVALGFGLRTLRATRT